MGRSEPSTGIPDNFTTLDQITERLAAFEERYNQRAAPFDWNFGRDDLDKRSAPTADSQAPPNKSSTAPAASTSTTHRLDLTDTHKLPRSTI